MKDDIPPIEVYINDMNGMILKHKTVGIAVFKHTNVWRLSLSKEYLNKRIIFCINTYKMNYFLYKYL
jgi:hypothetical protein